VRLGHKILEARERETNDDSILGLGK